MSLDWDISNVADRESKKTGPDGIWIDGLIWACMSVRMSGITEKNIVEFYSRLKFYNDNIGKLWGLTKNKDGQSVHPFPTFQQVRAWIGLKTNCTNEGYIPFMRYCKQILDDRFKAIHNETEKLNNQIIEGEKP